MPVLRNFPSSDTISPTIKSNDLAERWTRPSDDDDWEFPSSYNLEKAKKEREKRKCPKFTVEIFEEI